MKILPTLLFTILTIGLGSLVVLQQTHGNLYFLFGHPPAEVGSYLYNFEPKEVSRIHVKNSDGTEAVVIKKGGAWILEEPWEDYAHASVIKSVIDFASRLKIEDVIDRDDVEDMADFGLERSKIELELFDNNGSPISHFEVGRYTSWRGFDPQLKAEPGQPAPPSFPTLMIRPLEDGKEDYLYVCCDFNDPNFRVIPIRDLFAGGLQRFRNHLVFYNSPNFAGEIVLKEKNSEITLKRDGIGKDSQWRITSPFDLSVNPEAFENLMRGLSTLSARVVLDKSDAVLPTLTPENIQQSISIRYFLPNNTLSIPITANFYPPESEDSKNVAVIVSENEKSSRPAILKVPSEPGSILASLPRSVNDLRSRTLTSLVPAQIQEVKMSDSSGQGLNLKLIKDPHDSKITLWFVDVGAAPETYSGPANLYQINRLFEALFRDEVLGFTHEAATDPKAYGLDRPIRRIEILQKDGSISKFVIGEKSSPRFFARREDGGAPMMITGESYQLASEGKPSKQITQLLEQTKDSEPFTEDPAIYGLDQAKTVEIDGAKILLGQTNWKQFFATRLDKNGANSPHVVEISQKIVDKMPLRSYRWKDIRLWNINRYEITGAIIRKAGALPLGLEHEFYDSKWAASQNGKDVTSLLNTHRAEKLLKKITDIDVQHWLGPVAENAAYQLQNPVLEIEIMEEKTDEDGTKVGSRIRKLSIAEVVSGQTNRLFYAKTKDDPNYFLLDAPTVERLSVELLED